MEKTEDANKESTKPWKKNLGHLLTVHSILAALSALLIGLVVQDKGHFETQWKLPIFFLGLSFFLLALAAEKSTDALDEDDVEKYVFYLLVYNMGVVFLMWGMASVIFIRYSTSFLWLVIMIGFSLPWLLDIGYLTGNEERFREYVAELEGKDPALDWNRFITTFYFFRQVFWKGKKVPEKYHRHWFIRIYKIFIKK